MSSEGAKALKGRVTLETSVDEIERLFDGLTSEGIAPRRPGGRASCEVVPAGQLSQVIRAWVVRFLANSGANGMMDRGISKIQGQDVPLQGPWEYLSRESRVNVRVISKIVNEEVIYTSIENAEALLMAIDREYLLSNKTVAAIRNPTWSLERWVDYMASRGCV